MSDFIISIPNDFKFSPGILPSNIGSSISSDIKGFALSQTECNPDKVKYYKDRLNSFKKEADELNKDVEKFKQEINAFTEEANQKKILLQKRIEETKIMVKCLNKKTKQK
jgi:archaellum component FlaC